MKSFAFAIASSLIVFQAESQLKKEHVDYFIIERVDRLLIYNNYQQRITKAEEKVFVPFVPIRVLSDHIKLNDNYTPCMKVEVQGHLFYLIKDDTYSLVGSKNLGFYRSYQATKFFLDTVQVTEKDGHVLESPTREKRYHVRIKRRYIRYFQSGDWVYVHSLEGSPSYGWIPSSTVTASIPMEGKASRIRKNAELPPNAVQRVIEKLNEVNSVYTTIFNQFNKHSVEKKSIPHWYLSRSDRKLLCTLRPDIYAQTFPESDQYLLRDLENIFLGTNYMVTYRPGTIVIRNR